MPFSWPVNKVTYFVFQFPTLMWNTKQKFEFAFSSVYYPMQSSLKYNKFLSELGFVQAMMINAAFTLFSGHPNCSRSNRSSMQNVSNFLYIHHCVWFLIWGGNLKSNKYNLIHKNYTRMNQYQSKILDRKAINLNCSVFMHRSVVCRGQCTLVI